MPATPPHPLLINPPEGLLQLGGHFMVNEEHGVLICLYHQYAITPKSLTNHLAKLHTGSLYCAQRRAIESYVAGLDIKLRDRLNVPAKERHPIESPIQPVAGLRVHRNGLQCGHCVETHVGDFAVKPMTQHLREAHGIQGDPSQRDEHCRPVVCQQFFPKGPYFEVVDAVKTPTTPLKSDAAVDRVPETPPHLSAESVTLSRLRERLMSASKSAKAQHQARFAIVPPLGDVQTNPWLEHTKFQRPLANMELRRALKYVALPTTAPRDRPLRYLYALVKDTACTWQNTVLQTSRAARIRLMQEHDRDVPNHPLEAYRNRELRHLVCVQKIFLFFWRVLTDGWEAPPTLKLCANQKAAWKKLRRYVKQNAADEAPLADAGKHERTKLSTGEELCHEFWMSLLEQTGERDEYELALLTPIAFLSIRSSSSTTEQPRFREAYDFATDLSALKKFARFAGAQKMWDSQILNQSDAAGDDPMSDVEEDDPMSDVEEDDPMSDVEGDEQDGEEQKNGTTRPDEADALVAEQDAFCRREHQRMEAQTRERADEFRRWILFYLTTHYLTPMHWIIYTAQYASKIRYGENLDAFVQWDGDRIVCREISTSAAALSSMVWRVYDEAVEALKDLAFVSSLDDLPTIPWDALSDGPSNADPGHNLFTPGASVLAIGENFVVERMLSALKEKTTQSKLAIDNPDNIACLDRYGDAVQKFLRLLLVLCHCVGGQPGRATEVLSVLLENTHENGLRNLFLWQGLMALVPRYHKGYNRDKSVKTIYRFLPREIGSLLFWYLWLILPFFRSLYSHLPPTTVTRHGLRATSSFLWSHDDGKQYTKGTVLSDALKRATTLWMGQGIGISTFRHLLIALSRRIDKKEGLLQPFTTEELEDVLNEAEADAREVQAGHSLKTAHNVYALDIEHMFGRPGRWNEPARDFKASRAWHNHLGFQVEEKQASPSGGPALSKVQIVEAAERAAANVKALLRENLGSDAVFRPSQEAAVRAVLGGEAVVAHIAGTAAGKSLSYLLPALYPGYRQTIVIAPLVALRTDIKGACFQHRLVCSEWSEGQCDETASILLAMPEHIRKPSFVAMVRRLRAMGRLERIVIDEFHYVLLPDCEYRPDLRSLRMLSQWDTPVTLLSATIPVELEQEAFRLLGLPCDVRPIREPTTRSNLSYEVETIPDRAPAFTVQRQAAYVVAEAAKFGKTLVYVSCVTMADELATHVGCARYHGQMSHTDREQAQSQFVDSDKGILVATAAFNAGVHCPNIRLVLRLGVPDHVIGFSQESGRAGRDGKPSTARVVLYQGMFERFLNEADPRTRDVMESYLQREVESPRCRRVILDSYFDGDTKRQHCRASEAQCDVCRARYTVIQPASLLTPAATLSSSPVSSSLPSHGDSPLAQRKRPLPDPTSLVSPSPAVKRPRGAAPPPKPSQRSVEATIRFRADRQARALRYNTSAGQQRGQVIGRLFDEQLPATQLFWTTHCVKCFVLGRDFRHEKQGCDERTSSTVSVYRSRMKNTWGKPMCWTCHMPVKCCPGWEDTDRGLRDRGDRDKCVNKYAILDTWAELWENCPKLRGPWQARIDKVQARAVNMDDDGQFRAYFARVDHFDARHAASRLCQDVNWLTQTYFLAQPARHSEIQPDEEVEAAEVEEAELEETERWGL